MSKVALRPCADYESLLIEEALDQCFAELGGLSSYINPGDMVLLKPNMLQAQEPEKAITTHPLILEGVIKAVQEAGGQVKVGDSPGAPPGKISKYWKKCGFSDVCEKLDVELVNFEKSGVYSIEKNGITYHISRPVLDSDFIINLPKIKTHGLTIFSGGIKNMYGVIPGLRKTEYHKMAPIPLDFAKIVVDIFSLTKPNLNVADGVVGMEGTGPSAGTPRKMGIILVSDDAVALDSLICHILGKDPFKVPITRIAAEKGLGEIEIDKIEVLGEEPIIQDFKWSPDLSSALNRFPSSLAQFIMKFYWFRPHINTNSCTRCGKCIDSCPVGALEGEGTPQFKYEECIDCLCCMEMCPQQAICLEESPLYKIISRFSRSV